MSDETQITEPTRLVIQCKHLCPCCATESACTPPCGVKSKLLICHRCYLTPAMLQMNTEALVVLAGSM